MRRAPVALLTALAAAALLATGSPAPALESVDEVLCICSDDALNTGDFVSCVSHLSRRLVAGGNLTTSERQRLVSSASGLDVGAVQADCAGLGTGDMGGWGVGIAVGTPFYPGPTPLGPWSAAIVHVRLWNRSPRDVFQNTAIIGGDVCGFRLEIYDVNGDLVRIDDDICLPATGTQDVPRGTLLEQGEIPLGDLILPLVSLGATNGLVDGEPLPGGVYRIRVTWEGVGPNTTASPIGGGFDGLQATASITIRIG